jgi:CBS-domain-containing membrane protein
MKHGRESLKPVEGANRSLRHRLRLRDEFALALLPTVTVLFVLGFVEVLSNQRLLFAALASSAFLIYLDPHHGMNTVRALVIAHLTAAGAGMVTVWLLGKTYPAAALAMAATIVLMITLDAVHPPAVSTSLTFALRTGAEDELTLFILALAVTASLVILQRSALWVFSRIHS